MNRAPDKPPPERWVLLKGLRPSPLFQAEIDAFVKLYVKAPRPPEPPEAA